MLKIFKKLSIVLFIFAISVSLFAPAINITYADSHDDWLDDIDMDSGTGLTEEATDEMLGDDGGDLFGEGEGEGGSDGNPGTPAGATFKARCEQMTVKGTNYEFYPKCATEVNKCGSKPIPAKVGDKDITFNRTPLNCLFLEEPIGGDPGYDLYKVECFPNPTDKSKPTCTYKLWHGEVITPSQEEYISVRGPVQAILAYEEGKEYQGPFGLLYGYLGLIYKFMSGIIVGFVILISIIGGIEMTTSAGNTDQFSKGRTRIIKALVGMVLWFLASLILYTINPTFFAF